MIPRCWDDARKPPRPTPRFGNFSYLSPSALHRLNETRTSLWVWPAPSIYFGQPALENGQNPDDPTVSNRWRWLVKAKSVTGLFAQVYWKTEEGGIDETAKSNSCRLTNAPLIEFRQRRVRGCHLLGTM